MLKRPRKKIKRLLANAADMVRRTRLGAVSAKQTIGRRVKGNAVTMTLIILLSVALLGFVWSFFNYQKTKAILPASVSASDAETEISPEKIQELLNQVRRHIIVPANADVVATIDDAAGLAARQAFYKDAQNGDRLLIFGDKAVIYSPSRDIIVNAGPVVFEQKDESQGSPGGSEGE